MAQQEDCQVQKLLAAPPPSLTLQSLPLAMADLAILCDVSTGTPWPIVPLSWRHTVFDSLHSLSHPGIRATQRLINDRYVWPADV